MSMSSPGKPTKSQQKRLDKFKRLAICRTNKTLKNLELIGNLSMPAYLYNQEQVDTIFDALQTALNDAKDKLEHRLEVEGGIYKPKPFSLDD